MSAHQTDVVDFGASIPQTFNRWSSNFANHVEIIHAKVIPESEVAKVIFLALHFSYIFYGIVIVFFGLNHAHPAEFWFILPSDPSHFQVTSICVFLVPALLYGTVVVLAVLPFFLRKSRKFLIVTLFIVFLLALVIQAGFVVFNPDSIPFYEGEISKAMKDNCQKCILTHYK